MAALKTFYIKLENCIVFFSPITAWTSWTVFLLHLLTGTYSNTLMPAQPLVFFDAVLLSSENILPHNSVLVWMGCAPVVFKRLTGFRLTSLKLLCLCSVQLNMAECEETLQRRLLNAGLCGECARNTLLAEKGLLYWSLFLPCVPLWLLL